MLVQAPNPNQTATRIASQGASSQPRVGSQDYPPNPALDAWAGTAEHATVPEFFRMAVAKNPDGPFVGAKVGKDYQFRTYKEVAQQVEQFSSALVEAGIQPGDRVAVFAENSPDWRVADLGVAGAGAVHATLLAEYPDRTMEYVLKDSRTQLMVVDTQARLEQVLRSESRLPDLKTIVVTGDVDLGKHATSCRLVRWNDFMAQGAATLDTHRTELETRVHDLKASDIGSIVYTSGSTGDPKGVLISHGNLLSSVESVLRCVDHNPTETLQSVRRDDVYASILPLGHVYGRVADYVITAEGGSIAYPAGLASFKKDLPELKPTVLAITPLFFQKIYEGVEKKAMREDKPLVSPMIAGLVAGAGGAGLCALGGALAGSAVAGAGLAWALGITGAVVGGAVADHVATKAAENFTGAQAFQSAVATSKEYYQGHGRPSLASRVGHAVAEKLVFSRVREKMDDGLGGRVRVMISGGAPLAGEVETLFRGAGYNIAQGYGLSETTAGGLSNDPANAQLGTVGQPLPGVEVRLGEGNEIQVRGPNVMSGGYLDKPDKTRESFTPDGWYRTGDTGKVVLVPRHESAWMVGSCSAAAGAAAGAALGQPLLGGLLGGLLGAGVAAVRNWRDGNDEYYAVTGRIKSQFKLPGGEYVTPEPIEEDLKGSPYIAEAIVVGARTRDMVGALIVPKFDNLKEWAAARGIPTDPAQMVKHPDVVALFEAEAAARSANHAKHEVVRAVAVLDREFSGDEVTATTKVKRPVVLEHFASQVDRMFE